ncbi:esterase-like activity of phytase family protein [Pseudoroseicyclus tamaricis]|uniref:Esterase-like activity of phytase family protein n=1 Tax=Pseudoroseicyclus tamaricis TaxID=2705421 RepID=A0A6B2JLZ3_9RHOB|nr:esterase-like activity of phytase family protein [Pseudoroseicyclus tamaricis]NDU99646.1 esterase-like activity of phytase family protein [Pseudoroseicyclus tamaricis]
MSRVVLLVAAAFAAVAGCARGEVELATVLPLGPLPGGASAIEVSDDGSSVVLVMDRGTFVTGRLERQGDRLTGFIEESRRSFVGPDGEELPQNERDSEGLAIAADGTMYVSFEGTDRITEVGETLRDVLAPPDLPDAFDNEGYEALAIDAEGRLVTLPERNGDGTDDWTLLRLEDGAWGAAFTVPRRGSFVPVGADFGPDGNFYLLERDFTGFAFRSRVRRFGPDGSGETTLLRTAAGTHGNLEGIAVWRGRDGDLRLTMVSDDNELALLRSEIVEYRLAG